MPKKIIIKYFAIFLTIFLNPSHTFAQNINDNNTSIINWQKGYIISQGKASVEFESGKVIDNLTGKKISLNSARESLYDSARENAILKLTEALKSLRVDPENSINDIFDNNPDVQKHISNKINTSVIYKEYPAGFDSTVCVAKLDFGPIITALDYNFPSNDFPVRDHIPVSTAYTSLIVDCRGLDIKPMLFPSIYSDEGLEIYGKNFIDSSFAVRGGMLSYCYSEDQALKNARAGEHPYFAVSINYINSCPVLSETDTRRILSSKRTINNLKKCRVIFIIDIEKHGLRLPGGL